MKIAYIMRGIPGSGKSTTVQELIRGYDHLALSVAVHSTDDLCMVDGEYQFDIELAGARHAQNLENFKHSIWRSVPCVICDNTNVKTAQFQPYVDYAEAAGYRVVIVEMPHPEPGVAARRNSHGVPLEVIERMISDWEPAQESTKEATDDAFSIYETTKMAAKIVVAFGVGVGFGTLYRLREGIAAVFGF